MVAIAEQSDYRSGLTQWNIHFQQREVKGNTAYVRRAYHSPKPAFFSLEPQLGH
jgi:hypothetical protein